MTAELNHADFASFFAALCRGDLTELNAPTASAPVMLPAHVDCRAQTAPVPRPSPDVAPFLRGPRQGAPDVQVCWRADLDLSGEEGQDRAMVTSPGRPLSVARSSGAGSTSWWMTS